ncbi:ergothioneine biosynthesis protein EgtB [Rapidithrix thailandica]|uniref:Ergothioneine biosynthesis protein EgtB n=1 Tax=Rapidithrix thailandica TaxID=413964 RepID=A0AAW9SD25_9BACT
MDSTQQQAAPLEETQHLLLRYQNIRFQTEALCAPLQTEDYVVQPIVDVSPPKWHLGHSTWFFENFILAKHLMGYELYNPRYNYLFNSYYESQGERVFRAHRGNMTRPSVEEVMKFRKHVDQAMVAYLASHPIPEKVRNFIELGLQHEQQHQELLLTDLKYILGHNPLFPTYTNTQCPSSSSLPELNFTEINEGLYTVGFQAEGFCYDNETKAHQVYLHPYQIANRLATNREYLDFMQDNGYEHFEFWLSEGWDWVQQLAIKAPLYWHQIKGKWHQFTLSGLQEIKLDDPVTHINYFEADAFARWKKMRLPTEFEWEVACKQLQATIPEQANFQKSGFFHPSPANHHTQLFGDCWEWTQSAYLPYPGYTQAQGALGEYNGKFMVNQMVLRGGSCATPKTHIRPTYRNFFHTDKRWQFTGIRLAKSLF